MKQKKLIFVLIVLNLFFTHGAFAVSKETRIALKDKVFGTWQTVDDHSGKVTSLVNVYLKDERLYAQVTTIIPGPGEDPDPICVKCSDERKNQKVKGMELVSGLRFENGFWTDGKILDPDEGKEYKCKIWFEEGKLKVRGYIAFFYRTQDWLPTSN